jgi:hypothetical protein
MNKRSLALAALALVSAGCATIPEQKLAASPAPSNTRIVLLPVGIPARAEITVMHSTGTSFGLVGALVDGERFNAHEKSLAAVLDRQQFDFHAAIAQGVATVLHDDGYQVSLASGRPASTERVVWLTPLPDVKDADYALDVVFDYFGYAADWDSKPYLPSVAMKARLTDRSGRQSFYTRIVYNPALSIFTKSQGPKIPADEQYAFGSMGDIKNNPSKAAAGLEAAMQAVMDELRAELKGGPATSVAKSE